jgi:hypothetical protein
MATVSTATVSTATVSTAAVRSREVGSAERRALAVTMELSAVRSAIGALSVARFGATRIHAGLLAIYFAAELADFVEQGVEFRFECVETLCGGLRGTDAKLLTLALPLAAEATFGHGHAGPLAFSTIRSGTRWLILRSGWLIRWILCGGHGRGQGHHE